MSNTVKAHYLRTMNVSCVQVLDNVDAVLRKCPNPGLSDQEMRDVCRHQAFHWDRKNGDLNFENLLRSTRIAAVLAFSRKETERIVNRPGNVISMDDCEPAERPVQSEQFRPHDWDGPDGAA